MRKLAIASATVAVLLALPEATTTAVPKGTEVQTYKGNVAFPVDLDWETGTKRIFFTEKNTGKVRVMVGRKLLNRACVDLAVSNNGERGALGIALHPKFKSNHYLYVYYTNSSPLENRVTRFTVRNNRCRNRKSIVRGLSAASSGYHNGGQIEFVGGKLFVATGEAHSASLAQDTNNRLGKVLRLNPNGTVPDGNPFGASNPVWSYGHRNPFGLTHKPGTNRIYETENGPSCDDEVNRIRKGRNYGWGSGYQCGTAGVGLNPVGPIRRYSDIIVPTDALWYMGKLRKLNDALYFGDFTSGSIHRLNLNDRGTNVVGERVIHNDSEGITDVAIGPGRWMYFLTTSSIKRIVRN